MTFLKKNLVRRIIFWKNMVYYDFFWKNLVRRILFWKNMIYYDFLCKNLVRRIIFKKNYFVHIDTFLTKKHNSSVNVLKHGILWLFKKKPCTTINLKKNYGVLLHDFFLKKLVRRVIFWKNIVYYDFFFEKILFDV